MFLRLPGVLRLTFALSNVVMLLSLFGCSQKMDDDTKSSDASSKGTASGNPTSAPKSGASLDGEIKGRPHVSGN